MTTAVALTLACLAAVAVLLMVDWRGLVLARATAKLSASTLFVCVALALQALDFTYGRLVLGALLLGWVGDALLLSRAAPAFMGGLVAFLLSHLLYATAFASAGVSVTALGVGVLVALLVGVVVMRWLWPHTPGDFKLPVLVYVVVILAMCATAAGHAQASGRWAVLWGALLFAASDLAVARDRFVQPGPVNRLWGWPVYFVAQLVLAWTVAGAPGAPEAPWAPGASGAPLVP